MGTLVAICEANLLSSKNRSGEIWQTARRNNSSLGPRLGSYQLHVAAESRQQGCWVSMANPNFGGVHSQAEPGNEETNCATMGSDIEHSIEGPESCIWDLYPPFCLSLILNRC